MLGMLTAPLGELININIPWRGVELARLRVGSDNSH